VEHRKQSHSSLTFTYCICLLANILLRVFNIRFVRIENYSLYDYVISVHVHSSNSMSPITDEGNVDLLEWDGHILRVGEVQYLTIAVFYSSLIRLSGIDIFIPTISSFWDGLFAIPSISITENVNSGGLDFSHPHFQAKEDGKNVAPDNDFPAKRKRLMSPKRLPMKQNSAIPLMTVAVPEEERQGLLASEKMMNKKKSQKNNNDDEYDQIPNYSDEDDEADPLQPQTSNPSNNDHLSSLGCQLTFSCTHGLKIKVMKPLLTRFYEQEPLINMIKLDPRILLGLFYHGNAKLMVINMKEDVLFGREQPDFEKQQRDKQNRDSDKKEPATHHHHHLSAEEVEKLDVLYNSQEKFYENLKKMTYYEPWDEIFLTKNTDNETICKRFYGGKDYETLRTKGFEPYSQRKNHPKNNHKDDDQLNRVEEGELHQQTPSTADYFKPEDQVVVEPIQYSLLFYFYVILLLKDIDTNISKTLQEDDSYAQFLSQSELDDDIKTGDERAASLVSKQREESSRLLQSTNRFSLDNFQSLDIETVMKLYLKKNNGGMMKRMFTRLMNAYNEFIILILTLIDGKASGPVIFLVLVNAIVVGFANASRDIMSTHCGRKWYGSGDAWNEAEGYQMNNLYTDRLLIYFVSLCMSAMTQLTITNPQSSIIDLLVWSLAQVYLALMAFVVLCTVFSTLNTQTGLKIPAPWNKSLAVGIFFGFLSMLIPVVINMFIWFTPFPVLCLVMGFLQILFVLGLRFNREPHRFANAFFYSTIAEVLRLLIEASRYFLFFFEPKRIRKICGGLIFAYENHLNDLLMMIFSVGVFGGSILFIFYYEGFNAI
jgi:hypothetical protein